MAMTGMPILKMVCPVYNCGARGRSPLICRAGKSERDKEKKDEERERKQRRKGRV